MTHYSFDEDGVCTAKGQGYAVKRPTGMSDTDWEQHASAIAAALTKASTPAFPISHGQMILEYEPNVFVLFDGTDDGFSILGAYRTLEYTRKREAFYARMENEGPGPDDPMGFENAAALQAVLKDIWWKGFNNGKGQATAGHSAGYEHVDCTTDVDGYISSRLGRKS